MSSQSTFLSLFWAVAPAGSIARAVGSPASSPGPWGGLGFLFPARFFAVRFLLRYLLLRCRGACPAPVRVRRLGRAVAVWLAGCAVFCIAAPGGRPSWPRKKAVQFFA